MISIDTFAVENKYATDMYQRFELDWLICNVPLEYADLILSGGCGRIPQKGDAVSSFGRTGIKMYQGPYSEGNRLLSIFPLAISRKNGYNIVNAIRKEPP